ncbi:phage baseplate assembly protein V [Agromyces bracchium]|uniref:Gp5/Type VI secretion system Vgr protein OB-fold domain-containing protein n=1 Tax=Agromyces bracchium TaxID=88376 RepID=A0A6I3MG11_9MICO|nr:phage baseplate assembly protein V [Agromyces bracchium]MTH70306.1 hypothetical protein [Agromyces bracchium]
MQWTDQFLEDDASTRETRVEGVVIAEVVEILDSLMLGRVKVRLPWNPDVEAWAPVCAPFAGEGYGLWCMPQVGDAVVVAFEHGHPDWPVVVGSVWKAAGDPPIDQPLDAEYKRVLKTPGGHALVFDDLEQKISLTHARGHTLELGATKVHISFANGMGSLTLTIDGDVSLEGAKSVEVSAPQAKLSGDVTADVSAATTTVKADSTLRISGSLVTIN